MNHCHVKPIVRPTKNGPKLIGFECVEHGEIFTPNYTLSEPEASRPIKQFAAPSKWFPNRKHRERVKYAPSYQKKES